MPTEQLERDKYERRIDLRFHNPEVTAECLRQYDARTAAQGRLSEYKQSLEAQETLYRQMRAARREDSRKVADAERKAESATRECEKVSAALKEMRGAYAEAMDEAAGLRARNDALVREPICPARRLGMSVQKKQE